MEKVYKSGLCKGIGVSNMSIKYLERISRECEVIPAVNQVRFPLALGLIVFMKFYVLYLWFRFVEFWDVSRF